MHDIQPQTRDGRRQFASDNYAGICPEAWQAMSEANQGHAPSYGEDQWTRRASDLLRELFETDCDVYFCFNGTAANSTTISHLCQSYHSVICHQLAHIETDECGGPEFFSNGTKLLLAAGPGGRIAPHAVQELVDKRRDIHYPKPRVVSVTQATELGSVYEPAHLAELSAVAKHNGLRVHMDGARFANAVATLGVSPSETTWRVGVDVLCFGGTKNGMPVGEAVVFFDRKLSAEFDYRCKQAGQLASKMRFLAAPWVGMLESGAWLTRARHANIMAQRLAAGLRDITGFRIMHPPQANGVFVEMPSNWSRQLQDRGWHFYSFIASGGSRLMCSWDTTEADVDALLADARDVAGM